jgi:hypothetical protein
MNHEQRALIRKKRQLIRLRKEIIDSRRRWLEKIQPNIIKIEKIQGESERALEKILYFVSYGSWVAEIQTEIDKLKARINRAGYSGSEMPRKLWLPTIIQNAEKVMLKIYEAKSVRRVSLESAQKFAAKNDVEDEIVQKHLIKAGIKRWRSSETGRNYQIFASTLSGTDAHSFTDWTICLCEGKKLPIFEKEKIESTSRKDVTKIILYTDEKGLLYSKKKTKARKIS